MLTRAAPSAVPCPSLSACFVVTRADVQQALGRSVAKAEERKEGPESTCDYAGGSGQVTITMQRLTEKLDMRAEIESLKASIPDGSSLVLFE